MHDLLKDPLPGRDFMRIVFLNQVFSDMEYAAFYQHDLLAFKYYCFLYYVGFSIFCALTIAPPLPHSKTGLNGRFYAEKILNAHERFKTPAWTESRGAGDGPRYSS